MRKLHQFHHDEGGAILLFSLVGILILMLMTWTVMDAGKASRTKFEVQASADMAAYSQAAVKARSMNMLAYTNIAKRSIVGIHALYDSMFNAYEDWLIDEYWPQCGSGKPGDASCDEVQDEVNQWKAELDNDYDRFTKNVNNYYLKDLEALDNYQNYIIGLTPWWGWTEAVVRAQRNSATLATSYPPPPASSLKKSFYDPTDSVINRVGGGGHHNIANDVESLPVELEEEDARSLSAAHMNTTGFKGDAFSREVAANASLHQQASARGAALDKNIARGLSYFANGGNRIDGGRLGSFNKLKEWARPVMFPDWIDSEERWLRATSNIIITFQDNDGMFDKRRKKYAVPKDEYSLEAIGAKDEIFRPKGYWSMARSEISFMPYKDKSGKKIKEPDMWHARWTARMRPISLPKEFVDGFYDMNGVYYDIMPHLSLSLQIGSGGGLSAEEYFDEMVWMERATRGMGHSTIEGVAR